MILRKLKVKGFRSLKDVEIDFEDQLTLLIGKNDAGKSSVLDLLNIVLNSNSPDPEDFYLPVGASEPTARIEVVLDFKLNPAKDKAAMAYAVNNILRIRKVYILDENGSIKNTTEYWREVPEDEDLRVDNFERDLSADEQKEMIEKIDPSALDDLSNKQQRGEWLRNYVEQEASKVQEWKEAPSRSRGSFLPRFYRYSAMEYENPEKFVQATLQQIFNSILYDDEENGQLSEDMEKVKSKAEAAINDDVKKLLPFIKEYDPSSKDIAYDPIIDFSRALRIGEFQINRGRGFHNLSKTGDGTKRRILAAVLDWDQEVTSKRASEGAVLPPVLRGYDEPDANLDYDAQERMYRAISKIVRDEKTRTQAILCTHAPKMINRAPTLHIRRLSLDENGCTQVEQLLTDGDEDVEEFLRQLARELGITNTLMFYERCFILVEGATEENVLPILYRKIYDKSLLEDGIRLINVKSNGAAKEFLKLMKRNRKELTIVFLDSDTSESNLAQLTEEVFKNDSIRDDFVEDRLLYVGDQELEDAFPNEVIAQALQECWPRENGNKWEPIDIEPLREQNSKFSDALKQDLVYEHAVRECRSTWTKPKFGKVLARTCTKDQIPDAIRYLFEIARHISKCESINPEGE
jgi:putative ATP-dependent endonuclease of the OLD family